MTCLHPGCQPIKTYQKLILYIQYLLLSVHYNYLIVVHWSKIMNHYHLDSLGKICYNNYVGNLWGLEKLLDKTLLVGKQQLPETNSFSFYSMMRLLVVSFPKLSKESPSINTVKHITVIHLHCLASNSSLWVKQRSFLKCLRHFWLNLQN